ncbi:MAG: hypothetical protein QOJ29_3381 [Thermoleophilaceae bacterium]|jgi:acetyl-CoA acetyltransferase|nr:hypothetical protein [Thermoleophilaceae bacterium]
MTDIYVIGLALHPPAERHDAYRLEELTYHTARAALADAGVTRRQLDSVTLGACDELDGRPISSMLMAMPAGAFLTDETRVTDSGASALCLATARMLSGDFHLCLVGSWCKSSKTDIEAVMNARAEPFYTRPLGMGATLADALFAQAVAAEFGIDEYEVTKRVIDAQTRAQANDRGMQRPPTSADAIAASDYEATPLRAAHRAPYTDGAVCMVLASAEWLRGHPGHEPLARVAGVGWATDSYRLDRDRLRGMNSARTSWATALRRAGVKNAADLDIIEVEAQTGYHEAAFARAFELEDAKISPSGGAFAQNPLFCSGLINAAEAVLQLAGRAGPVQQPNVTRAAAHSCHGYAQQGNVVMVFEGAGSANA